jgi:molybdate transport system substrate-binding protein
MITKLNTKNNLIAKLQSNLINQLLIINIQKESAFCKFVVMIKNCLIFLFLFVICVTCEHRESEKLMIATAANMQFPMKELVRVFTENTGIECETVISSSGMLTAQIREGAPFDIFVSADMKYPAELSQGGFTRSPPEIYAYGKLILWTLDRGLDPSLELLTSDLIRHIALANPKTAPYGVAAVEVLKGVGIYERVENKLVFGESISQTSQFVVSKAAEIGFTAKSVVLSPDLQDKGNWIEMDTKYYSPIAQGVVILKNRKKRINQAKKFHDFLFSSKGKEILNKFGYSVPAL